jgi:hypothetical protein
VTIALAIETALNAVGIPRHDRLVIGNGREASVKSLGLI